MQHLFMTTATDTVIMILQILSFMLLFVCLCFRVQQWASVFSVELRDFSTKFSGSLLLQKVNEVRVHVGVSVSAEVFTSALPVNRPHVKA